MTISVFTAVESQPREAPLLTAMVNAGASAIHLRKPGVPKSAQNLLDGLSPECRTRTVIHEHYGLAEEYALNGVHIPSWDFEHVSGDAKLCNQIARFKTRSTSVHSFEELDRARSCTTIEINKIVISPVFDSVSKSDLTGRWSLSDLVRARGLVDWSVEIIALGGVTAERLRMLKTAGVSGCGVLGAIWKGHDPLREFQLLEEAWNSTARLC